MRPWRRADGRPDLPGVLPTIGAACSMNATCRQVEAPSAPVLS